MMRAPAVAAALLLGLGTLAQATNLDVTSEYRLRPVSYKDLNLGHAVDSAGNAILERPDNRSFMSQSARLGFALKDIPLNDLQGQSMDMVLRLRALGATDLQPGSPLTPPFQRIANDYPNTDFTPFFENAYVRTHGLGGIPWDMTVGRQTFSLGSGLLLDDDGAGITGVSASGRLPWLQMRALGFIFQTQRPRFAATNEGLQPGNVGLAGFSLEIPTEGTWQINQMIEKDQTTQFVAPLGCGGSTGPYAMPVGCLASKATRWFSSVRYQLTFGPLVFDGEAALQKGVATPTGPTAARNHITFNGNAQIVRAKWKQTFYSNSETGRKIQGIARIVVARGSGDNPSTPTTDEAFFPSHGHRTDGLERAGFGEFFGATPYDAIQTQSTTTASGLLPNASGIATVGVGITPPAFHGVVLDVDYFLYQADKVATGPHRTLGTELDLRLRYDIRDRLQFRASMAYFTAGPASDINRVANISPEARKPIARRYMLEAVARF